MTTLRFKEGVSVYGLQPEILWMLDACVVIWPDDIDVVVTSGRGDKHSRASLHYVGLAVDLRTRDMNAEVLRTTLVEVRMVLGKRFDIVYEGNHLHVEYQPKAAYEYPRGEPYR